MTDKPAAKITAMSKYGNRPMPAQKPGLSKQDYGTPPEFILAVMKRFRILVQRLPEACA